MTFAQSASNFEKVDSRWLKLLHYRQGYLNSEYKSDILSKDFFVHEKGRFSPELELEKSLSLLKSPDWKLFACRFPARFQYIRERYLNGAIFENIECTEFDEWKKQLIGQSISIVFSTPYSGNPASLFGHTLIKFNQFSPKDRAANLLNYASNFAAMVPEDENGILYAAYGLLGGYTGAFSLGRFYEKVNEYTYSENRDLWDYELNLKGEEIERLVAHLWELYHYGEFRYFFLNRNCSYQLLTLLEVARPGLDLKVDSKFRRSLYVLPIDTLKEILKQEGLLKNTHFLASAYSQLALELSLLSESELEIWMGLTQAETKKEIEEKIQSQINISDRVLGASASYFQYYRTVTLNKQGKSDFDERLRFIQAKLATREMTFKQETIGVFEDARPEYSHRSVLVAPGVGLYGLSPAVNLRFRLGFHDYSNSKIGFDRGAQNQLLDVQWSFYRKDENFNIHLDELTAVRLTSIEPLSLIKTTYSYDLFSQWKWGGWQNRAAIGLGFSLFKEKVVLFPNLFLNMNWRSELAWSAGVGSSMLILIDLNPHQRIYFDFEVQNRINRIYSASKIDAVYSHTVSVDREIALHSEMHFGGPRFSDEQRIWLAYRMFY